MALKKYQEKRHFERTPEPRGGDAAADGPLRFVVQKHQARRLHYDLRLECDGVLKSWAVPKEPTLDPNSKRLAIMVEDHPLEYRTFQGTIPKGEYGAGTVEIWDEGTYSVPGCTTRHECERQLDAALREGNVKVVLDGKKLRGEFAIVKMANAEDNAWLLIKKRDAAASGARQPPVAPAESPSMNRGLTPPARLDLGGIPTGKLPTRVKPMLATLVEEPFDRKDWIFEVKWDGYRAIAEVRPDKVSLYSRKQLAFNQYQPIVDALKKLGHTAVLDGEVVVLDKDGISRFQLLQNYQKTGVGPLIYYVFDILHLDGHDLRDLPLIRRKAILAEVIRGIPGVQLSEHIEEHGVAFFKAVSERGLEGIIAKNATSAYREGVRGKNWLKIKPLVRQEAIIAGFTRGQGWRKDFGALVLGVCEGDELIYIGRAGSGFDAQSIADLQARLEPLVQKACPFRVKPKLEDPVVWVKPQLVCEIHFREWTDEGHARFPIFLGLREDKTPESVVRERPVDPDEIGETSTEADPTPASEPRPNEVTLDGHVLKLTNRDKVFWPDEGYTKGDLIDYYRAVAATMLPHLKDRPLSLHRFPNGIKGKSFFQKDAGSYTPDWIQTFSHYSDSSERDIRYILCQNEATLVYLANLGCLELHPWSSRVTTLERPDFIIVDLDPLDVPFDDVVATAQCVRKVLERCGIDGVCKTSGKRGLHIGIALGARYDYDLARQFAQLIAQLVHTELPQITSLWRNPSKRQGLVYLDYVQNRRGQTLAAAYSVRPYPGATVSTPLRWAEVKRGLDPTRFTIRTVPKRLDKLGDLWQPVLGAGVDVNACLQKLS